MKTQMHKAVKIIRMMLTKLPNLHNLQVQRKNLFKLLQRRYIKVEFSLFEFRSFIHVDICIYLNIFYIYSNEDFHSVYLRYM